jgi:hypothetical protein
MSKSDNTGCRPAMPKTRHKQNEEKPMRKLALITLLAFGTPALAEDVTMDSVLGTTMEEVQASLTAMGYEVRKAEMEDGKIEVYFVRDGKMGEVYVSPQTGAVTKLEIKS